jgi:hypothetical protein
MKNHHHHGNYHNLNYKKKNHLNLFYLDFIFEKYWKQNPWILRPKMGTLIVNMPYCEISKKY